MVSAASHVKPTSWSRDPERNRWRSCRVEAGQDLLAGWREVSREPLRGRHEPIALYALRPGEEPVRNLGSTADDAVKAARHGAS